MRKKRDWPQKDKLSEKPKLVKHSLVEFMQERRAEKVKKLSPTSQRALRDLKDQVGRVVKILDSRNLTPESDPLLTRSLLRATPEELDSME